MLLVTEAAPQQLEGIGKVRQGDTGATQQRFGLLALLEFEKGSPGQVIEIAAELRLVAAEGLLPLGIVEQVVPGFALLQCLSLLLYLAGIES